uniref:Uncharacterized protein n=1 Tax=Anguilla anguilla TaxID=7936 RepID=A0A0E9Q0V5_ANGAN
MNDQNFWRADMLLTSMLLARCSYSMNIFQFYKGQFRSSIVNCTWGEFILSGKARVL